MNNSQPQIKEHRLDFASPSVIFLIAVNLFPFFGVFFLGWTVFSIIFLYWFENVIVGVFNVARMIFVAAKEPKEHLAKLFIIPFFCVHYGMFTAVHGVFVFFLFGMPVFKGQAPNFDLVMATIKNQRLGEAALFIFLGHAFSFFWNYLLKGEYRRSNLGLLLFSPYQRIVLLHVSILFGGFLLMALGSPIVGLCLFIFLKIIMDARAHLKEHRKLAKQEEKQDNVSVEEPWKIKTEA
ncbi:MAG: DUF6498-containing protein [Candidatus Omnitrophica bacterium]|nr:DUF6498-containing protein [Candidatus Omnitrophota bacterium]HOX54836.1 DUF6498-containing protein [Candidatus Omnitrophota bacterium]